ncbi:MAG: Dps family protein [Sediminibacterium sp.]|nr:Dps family protein [Sediminibacterium sp.]
MKTKNKSGIKSISTEKITSQLNELLAAYQVLYINTRGFHWNIKGHDFFEMHLKFEEMYTDFQTKIDEVAERILTLGATPAHSYSQYLKTSVITEQTDVSNGKKALAIIIESLEKILKIERSILKKASEQDDEGTCALMSDYIREQEKALWMYNAYLGK